MHERILPGALDGVKVENMDVKIDGRVVGKVVATSTDRVGLEVTLRIDDRRAFNALVYGRSRS